MTPARDFQRKGVYLGLDSKYTIDTSVEAQLVICIAMLYSQGSPTRCRVPAVPHGMTKTQQWFLRGNGGSARVYQRQCLKASTRITTKRHDREGTKHQYDTHYAFPVERASQFGLCKRLFPLSYTTHCVGLGAYNGSLSRAMSPRCPLPGILLFTLVSRSILSPSTPTLPPSCLPPSRFSPHQSRRPTRPPTMPWGWTSGLILSQCSCPPKHSKSCICF
ncbi:hypothetical protein JB92DRAFT_666521 [Gautieria morchelliformis]|nr:hypothetical protein JB92DRAFT_666521 [Gautieria morchelliformis]